MRTRRQARVERLGCLLAAALMLTMVPPAASRAAGAPPRTTVVVPAPISALVADGRTLAWWVRARTPLGCELRVQVFNRLTHRLATLRPDLNCEVPTIAGTALAGARVLYAVGSAGLADLHATVATIAVGERRPHPLTPELAIERNPGPGDLFGFPARVAGGGGRFLFITFDGGDWAHLTVQAWRLVGPDAALIPYQPRGPISVAVNGRYFAVADSAGAPTQAAPSVVELRNTLTGDLIRSWNLPGVTQVSLSDRYLVARANASCHRYDIRTGAHLGRSPCRSWLGLAVSGKRGVYRVGRSIRLLDLVRGRTTEIARAARAPVGPVIAGDHVFWAEVDGASSRVREVIVHRGR